MWYGINILVKPKSGDLYDEVSVNKAPIFIRCASEDRLLELLRTDPTIQKAVKEGMKLESLKHTARFCCRAMDNPEKLIFLKCFD